MSDSCTKYINTRLISVRLGAQATYWEKRPYILHYFLTTKKMSSASKPLQHHLLTNFTTSCSANDQMWNYCSQDIKKQSIKLNDTLFHNNLYRSIGVFNFSLKYPLLEFPGKEISTILSWKWRRPHCYNTVILPYNAHVPIRSCATCPLWYHFAQWRKI